MATSTAIVRILLATCLVSVAALGVGAWDASRAKVSRFATRLHGNLSRLARKAAEIGPRQRVAHIRGGIRPPRQLQECRR